MGAVASGAEVGVCTGVVVNVADGADVVVGADAAVGVSVVTSDAEVGVSAGAGAAGMAIGEDWLYTPCSNVYSTAAFIFSGLMSDSINAVASNI